MAKIARKAGQVAGRVFPLKRAIQTERGMMRASAASAKKAASDMKNFKKY